MPNLYDVGDGPYLYGRFISKIDGTDADPSTVRLVYKKPDATIVTLTYGVDGALIKDSTGHYHAQVTLDQAGRWQYRYEGTGAVIAVGKGNFYAKATFT